jgi:hypothetical protein
MPISHSEHMQLTCPQCGESFDADLWLVLDAQEHPAYTDELRQQQLHRVTCAQCSHTFIAAVPFLFHDGTARRVIFAPPPATQEYVWRDQARELHSLLVGSIPIEERQSYLSDVQIAQDIAGVAHILNKTVRRQQQADSSEPPPGKPIPYFPPAAPDRVPPTSIPEPPAAPAAQPTAQTPANPAELMAAVEALLTVNTAHDLRPVVREHPVLLTTAADEALVQLADVAVEEREYAVAEGLHHTRMLLNRLRAGTDVVVDEQVASDPQAAMAPIAEPMAAQPDQPAAHAALSLDIPPEIYAALLDAQNTETLARLTHEHPILLEEWVDRVLSDTISSVLDEGHESLAYALEQRRESLVELRQEALRQEAIELLLTTEDEAALAQVLINYPVLLEDEALADLWRLSSEARVRGDEELAKYAVECRAMLRKVREGLSNE